jgi:uncharacterized protein (DUF1800 family)
MKANGDTAGFAAARRRPPRAVRLDGPLLVRMLLQACSAAFIVIGLLPAAFAASAASPAIGAEGARHLLLRSGFAPTPHEVERYAGLDRSQAVQRLLGEALARGGSTVTAPPEAVHAPAMRIAAAPTRAQREALLARYAAELQDLRAWWFGEMLRTDSPLLERMTLLWHNHFATSALKVRPTPLLYRQNALLRQHALGSFRSLLHAVARDPAMLIYLDGALSTRQAPNENFAREVMELFTLGEGQYGQQDVREAARAFTGHGLVPGDLSHRFYPARHDAGVKTLFGRSGTFDADAALDLMLEQPQAARFIAGKLWAEFVAPLPAAGQPWEADDAEDFERVAAALRASDWQIAAALRVLFNTRAFWKPERRAQLVKSPVELTVGLLRQLELRPDDALPLALRSAAMGQNLFAPPNVKGWPGGIAWIDSHTLLERRRFIDDVLRFSIARGMERATPRMAAQPGEPAMAEAGAEPRPRAVAAGGSDGARGDAQPLDAAQAAARRALAERVRRGLQQWRFDAAGWLARHGIAPERAADAAARLALEQALLPQPPLLPSAEGTLGLDLLRAVLADPVYQLK